MNRYLFAGILLTLFLTACRTTRLPMDLDQNAHINYWEPTKYRQGWWYATGLLEDTSGNRFFHQFTIFHANRPLVKAFASHQSFASIKDTTHRFKESIYLEGKGSGSSDSVIWAGRDSIFLKPNGYRIVSRPPGTEIVMDLLIEKPLVLHGNNGVISMGHGKKKKQQSVYFSHTRLSATGYMLTSKGRIPIRGTYWYDRQFGPFTELNWYWYSIRQNDNTERMCFYFPGTGEKIYERIDANGHCSIIPLEIETSDTVVYQNEVFPMKTILRSTSEKLVVKPFTRAHFNTNKAGPLYWEGPCGVLNEEGEVVGEAVIELTGKRHR